MMNRETSKPPSALPAPPARPSLAEALAAATDTRDLRMGSGVVQRVAETFHLQFPGEKALVICDPVTWSVAGEAAHRELHLAGLASTPPYVLADPGLFAEHRFVEELEPALRASGAVAVAVGSGTINDLVKLASHRVGRPYLCVATAASMDGYTAFGASITHRGAKQTFSCPAPRAVVADLDILRRAPPAMTASGYADLQAKITAGADWLLAQALGVEPVDPRAWAIVQGGLREALADPAGARRGDASAIGALAEGLMLGGFAMQWARSSRPASGAEHQFSHLWDMQHHQHRGQAPSHGFKVAVATLAVTALYEGLLRLPLERLDIDACCAAWPDATAQEAAVRQLFAGEDFIEKAVQETRAKAVDAATLHAQLQRLRSNWASIRAALAGQLLPLPTLRAMLAAAGAPTTPEQIGLTPARLRAGFRQACHIRRRYTVLDLAVRTGNLDSLLATQFDAAGG